MGLSGRKTKQRIPDDPRNLCWADDAARFGSNYLAKFGWDASKGLGVAGDGRTSHIKVSHKLDLLGIGAAQRNDTDGIAWKQNKDFERLLQRLNNASAAEKNRTLESGEEGGEEEEINAEKKRKHSQSKTERKKKKKAKIDDEVQSSSNIESTAVQPEKIDLTVVKVRKSGIIPRHRTHRARAINAKNISSKSAAHISEILGIAPNPSGSSSDPNAGEPSRGKLTSLTDEVEMEMITTSTKTVTDYFKEKLNARFSSTIVSTSTTPRDFDGSYDTPRLGLGSRARVEISTTSEIGQETQRMGLLKKSTLSSPLACEKTLKDPGAGDPAATFRMGVNLNPQTKDLEGQKKKKRDEEIGEDGSACDDKNKTREREERKRKRKLNREKNDHVEPQDFDNDLGGLKKQEKKKRKAENLEMSVTSYHTDTLADDACVEELQKQRKENKKGCKSNRVEHTKVHVSE